MDDFKKRSGGGEAFISEIDTLAAQMQQLQQVRAKAEDLIAQKRYDEAVQLAKKELPAITNPALQELVNSALKEIASHQLDPQTQQQSRISTTEEDDKRRHGQTARYRRAEHARKLHPATGNQGRNTTPSCRRSTRRRTSSSPSRTP